MTTEFVAGTQIQLTWVYGSTPGTVTLHPDYRTFKFNQTVDVVDGTSGADTNKVKYMGMKDATCEITMVQQTGGTALNAALIAGNIGTLTIQPEGTATNKPKITLPAFCGGASYDFPYNDVAILNCTFYANGAYTIGNN